MHLIDRTSCLPQQASASWRNQQSIEKGRVAATLLLNSIESKSKPEHLELDTRLLVRGSCPE
jgi:DNA-binding LacI/PurR family transcriptional regulator